MLWSRVKFIYVFACIIRSKHFFLSAVIGVKILTSYQFLQLIFQSVLVTTCRHNPLCLDALLSLFKVMGEKSQLLIEVADRYGS